MHECQRVELLYRVQKQGVRYGKHNLVEAKTPLGFRYASISTKFLVFLFSFFVVFTTIIVGF